MNPLRVAAFICFPVLVSVICMAVVVGHTNAELAAMRMQLASQRTMQPTIERGPSWQSEPTTFAPIMSH